jgi:hypothetical protein
MVTELVGLVVAAEAATLAQNAEMAHELYRALSAHQGGRVPSGRPAVDGASVDYYLALLARTEGRLDIALDHLERALALHAKQVDDGWCARIRCELARVLLARGDWSSAARARMELEAVRSWSGSRCSPTGDEAAGLLARAHDSDGGRSKNVIECHGEFWTITFAGHACHVRNTRGLHHLAALLRQPWKELSVFALEELFGGRTNSGGAPDEPGAGERARVRVTRSLQTAIARISACHGELGRHLTSAIRTGRVCAYAPDPRSPMEWVGS